MALKLITPPTAELITLAEARDQLRIGTDHDDLVSRLLKAAITHTEHVTKLRLMPQTWKQTYHYFPPYFEVQLAPWRSLVSLKYTNTANQVITMTPDDYRIDEESDPVAIYPKTSTATWPDTHDDKLNAVELVYEVGFTPNAEPDDPKAMPEDLKQAVLYLLSHFYTNTEPVVIGAGVVAVSVPQTFDYLVSPYRRWLF